MSTEEDDFGNLFADVWQYSPWDNTWSQKTPSAPPGPLSGQGVAVADGRILFFGGSDAVGVRDDTWSYNPGFNSWEQKAAMPISVPNPSAAYYSGKIYVFANGTFLCYDPSAGTWQVLSPPGSDEPSQFAAVAPGEDGILSFGGEDPQGQKLSEVWSYGVNTNIWTPLTSIPIPISGCKVAMGSNSEGQKYYTVFGGYGSAGPIYRTFRYFPDGEQLRPPPRRPLGRF